MSLLLVSNQHTAERNRDCDFSLTPDGVYLLDLKNGTQAAAASWQYHLYKLYLHAPRGFRISMLTDATDSVLPPMALITLLGSVWMERQTGRVTSRHAILHPQGCLTAGEHEIVRTLSERHHSVRLFKPAMEREAMRWLVGDD